MRRVVLILAAAAFVAVGGSALAQEATEQPPTPSPTGATVAPAATPPPPKASETPVPTVDPASLLVAPVITPWPWPFPWMQETAQSQTPAPVPAVPSKVVGAPSVAGRLEIPRRVRAYTPPGQGEGSGFTSSPAPPAPEGTGGIATKQGEGARVPGDPASATFAPAVAPVHTTCAYNAIEHGLSGDRGSILQVAVQNEDCSWGGGQVLVAYDIRGPPVVDVLAQSAAVTIDVEAYVTKEKIRLGYGYAGANGRAPVAVAPLGLVSSDGDTSVFFRQDAFSGSGDAVSGSQRVGVTVEGDASAVRVLAQNASVNATALSGDAGAANGAATHAGPAATGPGTAKAGMKGDNSVAADQHATARSGDAVAGTQIVDVAVSGSVGEVTVLAQNASPGAKAISGDAMATNAIDAAAGPTASTPDGAALAGQLGDNRVDVHQTASAASGDAIAGSQLIGVTAGGSAGEVNVMAANASDGAYAQSGDASATNLADVSAGPFANGSGLAGSSQVGDNVIVLDQAAFAQTGRALAGSQVIGVTTMSGAGQASLQSQNSSPHATALTGAASATNMATATAGPSATSDGVATAAQTGSNAYQGLQDVSATAGDSVAGGRVVAILGSPARLS